MSVAKFALVAAVAATLTWATLPAQAADQPELKAGVSAPGPGATAQPLQLQRAEKIIGMHVKNASGDDLGVIRDIVLTRDHSSVAYLVLAHGGVLTIGEKLFAVPLSAVQIQNDRVLLNIDKARLDQASGFDRDRYPLEANYELFGGSRTGTGAGAAATPPATQPVVEKKDVNAGCPRKHKGEKAMKAGHARCPKNGAVGGGQAGVGAGATATPPATQPAMERKELKSGACERAEYRTERGMMHRELGMMPERRVSKIIGKDVRTSDNQSLGEIDDLVLDVGTGQVAFVVVGFGGVAGLGEKVALVPLSAIEPRRDFVLVNADRQKIESMAFEEGNFPDLTDRQYTMRVYQSYGVQPYWEVYGYQGEAAGARGVSAWTPGSDYLKKFDAGSVKTIEGTIESVGTFRPAPDAMEGLRLRVRTADGLISVHAGPAGFIERHDVSLNVGDKVRITGAKTDFSGRPVILASAICLGDKSVVLREKDGTPAWKVEDLSVGGRPMERRMTPAQPERTAPRTVEPAPSTPPAPSTY